MPIELTDELIRKFLPERPRDSHKGMNGHCLLCVGSDTYIGAALLCAKAALRAGSGLITVATTAEARRAFSAVPEAITVSVGSDGWNEAACAVAISNMSGKQAIAIGSGIGTGEIAPLLKAALISGTPLVIDADGLNRLAENRELFSLLHPKVVLTPHIREMARLTGMDADKIKGEPVQTALRFAREWNCIVLLKDAQSYISDGKEVFVNTTGNSGLAKGGSGDVLCGITAALAAQGLSPLQAACTGSYLLGISADRAMELLKTRILLASDVIEAIELF
ncbi:MAG: NAD(P)H-hydrate dehydratase [Clostridia bacterium]|nr:NAD(P)H-hydrate dehydratase [Clostridia bacterium]